MTIAETIAAVIKSLTLKQMNVALATGVNEGQLSNYLSPKKRGPLSDERIVTIIHYLIGQIDETSSSASANKKQERQALREALAAYPAYRRIYALPKPGEPIPWEHELYVKLMKDAELQKHCVPPFVLGLVSGCCTGKTTLALAIQTQWVERGEFAYYFDCREYVRREDQNVGFVRWLTRKAANQSSMDFFHVPATWEDVPQWLREDILSRDTVFVFDNVDSFDETLHDDFFQGWNTVLNRARNEPVLDRLSLVVAQDQGMPMVFLRGNRHTSRVEMRMVEIPLPRMSQGQVGRFVKAILGNGHDKAADEAWNCFRGHPYLTHVYANEFKTSGNMEAALAKAAKALSTTVLPKLSSNVYGETLRRIYSGGDRPNTLIEFTDPTNYGLLLQDTGLFEEASQRKLRAASAWLQDQLIAGFSCP